MLWETPFLEEMLRERGKKRPTRGGDDHVVSRVYDVVATKKRGEKKTETMQTKSFPSFKPLATPRVCVLPRRVDENSRNENSSE